MQLQVHSDRTRAHVCTRRGGVGLAACKRCIVCTQFACLTGLSKPHHCYVIAGTQTEVFWNEKLNVDIEDSV